MNKKSITLPENFDKFEIYAKCSAITKSFNASCRYITSPPIFYKGAHA